MRLSSSCELLREYFSEVNQKVGGTQTVENMMNVIYDHKNKAAPRENEDKPLETREAFVTKKYKLVVSPINLE